MATCNLTWQVNDFLTPERSGIAVIRPEGGVSEKHPAMSFGDSHNLATFVSTQ